MTITKSSLSRWDMRSACRVRGGNNISLDGFRERISEKLCDEYGLHAKVELTTMITGKLLDKSTWKCIVISSLDHPNDYNYIVISYEAQGIFGLFDFFMGGNSKNAARLNAGGREHSTLTGQIIGAVRKAMVSENQLHEEEMFYTSINDALDEIFE